MVLLRSQGFCASAVRARIYDSLGFSAFSCSRRPAEGTPFKPIIGTTRRGAVRLDCACSLEEHRLRNIRKWRCCWLKTGEPEQWARADMSRRNAPTLLMLATAIVLACGPAQAKKCADYPEDHPVRQTPYCQSELPPKQGDGFLSDLINLPNTVVKDAADAVLGRSGEPDTEQASESDEAGTEPEVEQEQAEANRDRRIEPAPVREVPPRREPTPAEAAALERVRAMLEAHQAREVCAETALEQGEIVTEPAVLEEALAGHEAAVKIRDAETGEFLFSVRAVCEAGEPAEWVLAGRLGIGEEIGGGKP